MIREKISPEEAKKLEQRSRHKELVTVLKKLDNGALQQQMLDLMDKAVTRLIALQTAIDELKVKTGEPITVSPQVTVENGEVGVIVEKALTALYARMEHELARLQSKEKAQEMHIEFTRSETGYIQSPIIVKPA